MMISIEQISDAREIIAHDAVRTPLLKLNAPEAPADSHGPGRRGREAHFEDAFVPTALVDAAAPQGVGQRKAALEVAHAHVEIGAAHPDVHLVQVLSAAEKDPELSGDFRLIDSEEEDGVDVTGSGPLLEAYRRSLTGYLSEIEQYARIIE